MQGLIGPVLLIGRISIIRGIYHDTWFRPIPAMEPQSTHACIVANLSEGV